MSVTPSEISEIASRSRAPSSSFFEDAPEGHVSNLEIELKDQVQELEAARKELVSRERNHLEWLAYLSHDLATPLVRVLRRIESIQYDSELLPPAREELLEDARRDVTELAEIVGSLSQFAILESSVERLFVPISLGTLLEQTVEGFAYEASCKEIELSLSVQANVGTVRIERSLVRRAIENLISNAIRYTSPGGTVTVEAHLIEQQVQMVVEDTGTGVPVQELERVFDFAFRGEGQTRIGKVGALGLGLALVKKVAEIHAGSVTASNVEPHGARFVLSIRA